MVRPKPVWTPPARDGVGASRVGVGSSQFSSVLHFLKHRFPAVGDWPARLQQGDVLDATGQALRADSHCLLGMVIWYWRNPPAEHRVPFPLEVLFQDDCLVVVDKPHFMPVTPGGRHLQETALVQLKRLTGIDTLAPMHRLDRETAGVLVFTVQPGLRHTYHSVLHDRKAVKTYEAIAPWRADLLWPHTRTDRLEEKPGAAFMQMQVVSGEPNAQTRIEVLEVLKPGVSSDAASTLARYRLSPLTGRKHQLRVHMNELGLPIVGDRIYPQLLPDLAPGALPDYSRPLQLLAREFAFTDPVTGQERRFTSRQSLQVGR